MPTKSNKARTHMNTQAEEALGQSERRFRALVENSADITALVDAQGIVTYVSPSITPIMGYTPEEFIGCSALVIVHPDDLFTMQQVLGGILQSPGSSLSAEYRLRCKDGSWRWFEGRGTNLLHDPDVGAIVGNFRDITQRKEAEERLQQSEEQLRLSEIRYRTMIEQSPLSMQILSPDGRTILVNHAWEELWGVTLDQIAGYNMLEDEQLVAKDIMSYIKRAFAGEAAAIPPIKYEPDQTIPNVSNVPYRWVRAFIYPIKEENGKIREVVLIHEDISEQKRVEEELRRSRDQLSVIFQHVADGITVQDRTGAIVYVNDIGARRCGFSSAEEMLAVDTQTFMAYYLSRFEMKDETGQLLSSRDLPAFKALQGEPYAEVVVHYLDKQTGTSSWSLVKASPIFDEKGEVQFAVNIFSDITERKELERRKDEFISMASHELKTPLTSLKAYTQLLLRKFGHQEMNEAAVYLPRMELQINKLTRLIQDLLDVSKVQVGKLDYAEDNLDIDALVRQTVETLQQTTTTHRLSLQGTTHKMVRGDSERLEQVLTNIISNAIKYSPSADRVDVQLTSSEDTVTISVRDYGIGVPKEHQEKIFERFYRVGDDRNQLFPGLGIGLYISREIIERHAGKIWVESAEGKGSTFYVTLPISSPLGREAA